MSLRGPRNTMHCFPHKIIVMDIVTTVKENYGKLDLKMINYRKHKEFSKSSFSSKITKFIKSFH